MQPCRLPTAGGVRLTSRSPFHVGLRRRQLAPKPGPLRPAASCPSGCGAPRRTRSRRAVGALGGEKDAALVSGEEFWERNPEERDAKEGPPSFQDILVLLLAAIMILSLLRFFFRVLVIFLSVVAAAWNYSFLAVVLIMIIGLFTV